jgi:hypothetical protein
VICSQVLLFWGGTFSANGDISLCSKAVLDLLVDLLISVTFSGTLLGGPFSATSGEAFPSLTCGMLLASGEVFSSFTGMIPATVAVECSHR